MSFVDVLDKSVETDDVVEVKSSTELIIRTEEDKLREVYRLKMTGLTYSEIALRYGVSTSTIHNWIKKYVEESSKELEVERPLNLITESVLFLQTIQQVCLRELGYASLTPIDPDTGEFTELPEKFDINIVRTRTMLIDKILESKRLELDLLVKTGVIPKEPDKLYAVVKDATKTTAEEGLERTRSPEEVKQSIEDLLSKVRLVGVMAR